MKIYLAGPEVFLVNDYIRNRIFKMKRDLCNKHGFGILSPADNNVSGEVDPKDPNHALFTAETIYKKNLDMVRQCDGVIANLTPYSGVSADVGTVWEIGAAKALGKTVIGYTLFKDNYLERSLREPFYNPELNQKEFGLPENLMIYCGCDKFIKASEDIRIAELGHQDVFEQAVEAFKAFAAVRK